MTKQERSDKWFKWFLVLVALYFLGHIAHALADTVIRYPDGTIHRCVLNNIGVLVCI